jgi:hypothetical protein
MSSSFKKCKFRNKSYDLERQKIAAAAAFLKKSLVHNLKFSDLLGDNSHVTVGF